MHHAVNDLVPQGDAPVQPGPAVIIGGKLGPQLARQLPEGALPRKGQPRQGPHAGEEPQQPAQDQPHSEEARRQRPDLRRQGFVPVPSRQSDQQPQDRRPQWDGQAGQQELAQPPGPARQGVVEPGSGTGAAQQQPHPRQQQGGVQGHNGEHPGGKEEGGTEGQHSPGNKARQPGAGQLFSNQGGEQAADAAPHCAGNLHRRQGGAEQPEQKALIHRLGRHSRRPGVLDEAAPLPHPGPGELQSQIPAGQIFPVGPYRPLEGKGRPQDHRPHKEEGQPQPPALGSQQPGQQSQNIQSSQRRPGVQQADGPRLPADPRRCQQQEQRGGQQYNQPQPSGGAVRLLRGAKQSLMLIHVSPPPPARGRYSR